MTNEVLIGGYTERLPHVDGHSPGIWRAELHEDVMLPPAIAALTKNPSWLTTTRNGDVVYAVEESSPGALVTLHRSRRTGQWNVTARVPSGGNGPAHLALSPREDRLVAANYGSGSVAVHEIRPDKQIGGMLDLVQHAGTGPDPRRQEAAHPHQIVFEPGTDRLFVPDLGTDSVFTYQLQGSRLVEIASERLVLSPGTGPRHLVFHPDGRHLLILGELSATIDVFSRSEPSEPFTHAQRISILQDRNDVPAAAEVLINGHGTVVFATNRGPRPSIAVLCFDKSTGQLALANHAVAPAGPRAMALVSHDRLLLVAGQDSDEIVPYAFDPSTLALAPQPSIPAPSPACIVEMPTAATPVDPTGLGQ